VQHLLALLARAEEAGFGQVYVAPFDVTLDPHDAVQPDVLLVTTARLAIITEAEVAGAPDLVAEVLSPSIISRDLGVKLRTYARFGVRFYWIVDPDAQSVQTFSLENSAYAEGTVLKAGDRLGCPLFPGVELDVGNLFR